MAAGLLQHTLARIDDQDGQIGGGRTRHHVPGVLLMPRRVGDDELATGRGEVAIRDVDGDALLTFSLQTVGQQGKIQRVAG